VSAVDELIAFVRRCLDDDERNGRRYLGEVLETRLEHDAGFRLAEVATKRKRLDWIEGELADDPDDETAQWLARLEAQPYAGRDGWRTEWAS
jgi:hypothetical protein